MSLLPFTETECRAIFSVAGIKMLNVWEIPNRYTTLNSHVTYYLRNAVNGIDHALGMLDYLDIAKWFLVQVPAGHIVIGPRKRVLSIDWEACEWVRQVPTEDDVTKGDHYVHAWTHIKAVEYLNALNFLFNTDPKQQEIDDLQKTLNSIRESR